MIVTNPHKILAVILFLCVVSVYTVAAINFPFVYIWMTYEDGYGEWAQFYFFVAASFLSLYIVGRRSRFRIFFLLLAMACLYTLLEEISWGQRLFGFSSPDFFKQHNLQSETNLHNFLTGPYRTSLKTALEYLIAASFISYGLVLPLFNAMETRVSTWLERIGFPIPPLYLSVFFISAAVLELNLFSFNEAEIAEILVGMALTLLCLHYCIEEAHQFPIHQPSAWSSNKSTRLARYQLIAVLTVTILAIITTQSIYAFPDGREGIDRRILNGVNKFAKRYERYGRWDRAIELYRYLYIKEPKDASILRKLSKVYTKSHDVVNAKKFATLALNIDLLKYKDDQESASINRSLFSTYNLLGDDKNGKFHIRKAIEIGLSRVREDPESAHAAYSLGKTYRLVGQTRKALRQFERAVDLNPNEKKFRKAHLKIVLKLKERPISRPELPERVSIKSVW